ncbi:hypothetical protein [Oceanobacillus sp. FSL H7-0719]|uniref:hypothetical protein n=1 Tax=Oceanobacillus sp. FSL H7-0719 TaxID=2954507 RepID=UPI00325507AF
MLQHPTIERIERTGYPFSDRREEWGTDGLNNEVYSGDEIIEFMDDFYLLDELSADAIEILEQHGGQHKIAK